MLGLVPDSSPEEDRMHVPCQRCDLVSSPWLVLSFSGPLFLTMNLQAFVRFLLDSNLAVHLIQRVGLA